jgi:hypothetical protein
LTGAAAASGFRSNCTTPNSASGRRFSAFARAQKPLELHALAYNLSNFLLTLALPDEMESWSLTTIREKVVKIGAKVIAHARYAVFQMTEVAVPPDLCRRILDMILDLRPRELSPC